MNIRWVRCLAALMLLVSPAAADEGEKLLRSSAEVYQKLTSFESKLRVTTRLADAEIVQVGTLKMQGSRIVLMLRDEETRQWAAFFHSDGEHQYQLDWNQKKLVRRKIDAKAPQRDVAFFPGFDRFALETARLEETVTDSSGSEVHRVSVEIKGSTERSAFRYARLEIESKSSSVRRMEFMSPLRRTVLAVEFSECTLNPKFGRKEFVWTKPVGLQDMPVVDADE